MSILKYDVDMCLQCDLDDVPFWGEQCAGRHFLLALITPCKTNGRDATDEVVSYSTVSTKVVVDLQTVTGKIGRVKTRGKWGLIDQSTGVARTIFVDPEEEGGAS